jgi:hypothetical protein
MKIYSFGILLAVLIVLPCVLLAQDRTYPDIGEGIEPAPFAQVGMTGWQFLKLPTHARYAALGGVSTVFSRGDAGVALANPASLADIENTSVVFSKMNWLVDTDYNTGAIVKNFGEWGHFGLTFIYLDYGSMPRTGIDNLVDDSGEFTGQSELALDLGNYSAHDLAVGLSYARNITDRLQVGGNLRYISEKLDNASNGGVSLDIGTVYYTGLRSLRIAMVGRSFGPDTEIASYDDRIGVPASAIRMPSSFHLGMAYDLLEGGDTGPHMLTIGADFVHLSDASEKVNVAAEYGIMDMVYLRGGYRFNYDEEDLTFGAGINVMTSSLAMSINYAFLAFGRFDDVHMFSIGLDL